MTYPRSSPAPAAALAGLLAAALALVGCGGSSSPAASPPASGSTSGSASGSPSASPSAPATSAPARVRTAAELRRALLTLRDLPPGFKLDTSDDSDDDGSVTSDDPRCAAFVRRSNRDKPERAKAEAERSFVARRSIEFLDEGLAAFASADGAARWLSGYRSAAASCRTVRLAIPGEGTFNARVSVRPAPGIGDDAFLQRIVFASGKLRGLEIDDVLVRSGDVLVDLTLVNAGASDIEAATRLAVGKVEAKLTGGAAT